MGHMIKQLGSNLLHGKSIIDITLPIKIFEKQSFLEKLGTFQVFAPIYLEKAAGIPQDNFNQALQRFKLVITYAVAMRITVLQMKKPFNPILGETYQARIGQYKLICE